jgi:hypothetical protein
MMGLVGADVCDWMDRVDAILTAAPAAPGAAVDLAEIRRAVADYMWSEGCSCCRDSDAHERHEKRLAELLGVPPYDDGSGFDFRPFSTAALAGKAGA